MIKKERTFKVVDVRKQDGCSTKFKPGRYVSSTPAGAAKKAFSELCRVKDVRGRCALYVKIAETTQDSKKKEFMYHMQRHTLEKPLIYKANGKEIRVRYKNTSKSVNTMPGGCKHSNKSHGPMKTHTARVTGGN